MQNSSTAFRKVWNCQWVCCVSWRDILNPVWLFTTFWPGKYLRTDCPSTSQGFPYMRAVRNCTHIWFFKSSSQAPWARIVSMKKPLPLISMEVERKFHLCLPEATRESVQEGEDLYRPLVLARKNLCHARMVRVGVAVVHVNDKPSASAPSAAHYTVVGGGGGGRGQRKQYLDPFYSLNREEKWETETGKKKQILNDLFRVFLNWVVNPLSDTL